MAGQRYMYIHVPNFSLSEQEKGKLKGASEIFFNMTTDISYQQATKYFFLLLHLYIHVPSSQIIHNNTNNKVYDDFPNISHHLPKISKISPKLVWRPHKCFQTFFQA